MATFLDLAKKRKTSYEFDSSKKISKEDLRYILEAARWAPSCGNLQPWKFILVRDKENIKRLLDSTHYIHFPFINPLPPLLIVFVLRGDCMSGAGPEATTCAASYDLHASDIQTCLGMAVLNASLAAAERDIGSCILTPRISKASALVNAKEGDFARLFLGLGYEKKGAHQKKRERIPLKEMIFEDHF